MRPGWVDASWNTCECRWGLEAGPSGDPEVDKVLDFLGHDAAMGQGQDHYAVDLDALSRPRLVAFRDFVARQFATTLEPAAKRS